MCARIAVLGAGPAGLMTAWAVERNGHEPVIYARKDMKSPVNPDMFLMQELPGLPGSKDFIYFAAEGTEAGYALKAYGDVAATTSWKTLKLGAHPIWWLDEVYSRLFFRYTGRINEVDVGPGEMKELASHFPLVLSTLPAQALCSDPLHLFYSVPSVLYRKAEATAANSILYNGGDDESYYRYSSIRGWKTFEYPMSAFSSHDADWERFDGRKVVATDCDCNRTVERVGRWAQHTRGVLNHHAYTQATSFLASHGLGKGA